MLEAILAPCNYLHKERSEEGLEVDEQCIYDSAQQFEYLSSSLNMRILYNTERFDPTKYGDDKIIKESLMSEMQFNPHTPSFVGLNFLKTDIEDETDLI